MTEKGGAMEWLQRSALSSCLLFLAACGGGSSSPDTPEPEPSTTATDGEVPSWSLPTDPMSLAREAGLTPDVKEYFTYHVHAHLDVFVDGHPVEIPGGIGIEITDPAVQSFGSTGYGGIPEEGCEQPCISPLHTHDVDGVIHIEAPSEARFTLGQFFMELAVRLDASCVDEYCTPDTPVAVYVDGQRQSGDPADIVLGDQQEIAIVIGTPPEEIPDTFTGS
jgi:hypothetical protein